MRPFPKVIRIEPAGSCNLKCTHCPTGLGKVGQVGVMRMETFEKILATIRPHAPYRSIVLYHGGEPLLNTHLSEMADRLRRMTKHMKVTTNGTLFDEGRIADIVNFFDEVEISLDGNSPAENDHIRAGSRFESVVTNAVRLIKAATVGRPAMRVTVAATMVSGHGVPKHLREAFSDYLHLITWKIQPQLIWPKLHPAAFAEFWKRPDTDFCDHVVSTMTFRWNGDVVPCCYDLASQAVMGNVLGESAEDVWNGPKFEAFRAAIENRDPPALCRGCRVLYAAKGPA